MAAPKGNLTLRIILPVLIGLAVVAWLFHDDFNARVWQSLTFDRRAIAALVAAVVFMAGRDFGLSWHGCFTTTSMPGYGRA